MDVKVYQQDPCSCGRGPAGMGGTCGKCTAEGAEAFWLLYHGQITYPGFIRRLNRRKK